MYYVFTFKCQIIFQNFSEAKKEIFFRNFVFHFECFLFVCQQDVIFHAEFAIRVFFIYFSFQVTQIALRAEILRDDQPNKDEYVSERLVMTVHRGPPCTSIICTTFIATCVQTTYTCTNKLLLLLIVLLILENSRISYFLYHSVQIQYEKKKWNKKHNRL